MSTDELAAIADVVVNALLEAGAELRRTQSDGLGDPGLVELTLTAPSGRRIAVVVRDAEPGAPDA